MYNTKENQGLYEEKIEIEKNWCYIQKSFEIYIYNCERKDVLLKK